MVIKYKKGDVTEAEEPIIAHGCNAQGVMGSGVAKAIKSKFPTAYKDYRARHLAVGLSLGRVYYSYFEDKVIANCITQEYYGRTERRYVSYDALAEIFYRLDDFMAMNKHSAIAMPRIGAGLGGGDWSVIALLIELNFSHAEHDVVIYDL